MIKMYIAGEEVVCNKEFTIKEEMLSTSSTILNNCYPKSWEQDHDYTSRFYYPKDYSKCLINRVEEEQTLTENGTIIGFNDLIKPTLQDLKVYGNTYQANSILPSEYTQVDYIASSGTQYIDTNVYGNLETEIITRITNDNCETNFLGDITVSTKAISCNFAGENVGSRFGNKYVEASLISLIDFYEPFLLKENKSGIYINNEQALEFNTTTNFQTENTLLLFTRNNLNGPNANRWKGKLFYCKIYNSGNLIRNFIPCYRNSDNEVGLYDLVNDVFYTNQGAGSFTYGNIADIPNPEYPQDINVITGEQVIQVTNNNVTTNYPLSLGSIKLCKIGNYQDYIYKQNGNWYIYKVIDKIVLNGTESDVSIRGTGTNNWFYCFKNLNQNTPEEGNGYVLSNYYSANRVYTTNTNEGICVTRTSKEIRIRYGQEDTLSNFLNWVSTHNIDVYYVMTTPTTTQITDTTLINQLENISITKGNNVITTENNTLPFDISMTVYDSGTELLFAGMVKNSGNISLNPRDPKYCALEILDFKDFLSTGEYLDFVISNKTVLEAIQMVVDSVAQYGFVLGNVNILGGTDIIGAYSTQEKSAYDVFQYLADITGSRWTTRMIDENTIAIDFYDPTLMPQGIDIEYNQQWWEDNLVNDLKFSYGSRDYRNKQVMLSNQVYGGTDYSETILGDGYNKNFITTENIGLVKAIYVNGTEVSFSTNVDKELGIDTDFYYTPGENVVSSNENQQSYSAGTQIVVSYTPLIKGREVIYNTDEVNRVNSQIERKGVVARYEQRNDILYTEDLEKIGQSYIKYKGTAEVILTLTTQLDIYNVGEIVYFNAPIQDLAQNYMVKKKSTQIIATGDYSNVWYTYQLTSSFNSETAINWFDNQRNKVSGNISEGEYITRNIDIENTANVIWDNLTITEVTVTEDNVLNSPLNSPFIQ